MGEKIKGAHVAAHKLILSRREFGFMSSVFTESLLTGCSPKEESSKDEQAESQTYSAGTYKASSQGRNGMVTLDATFSDTKITDIQVTDSAETAEEFYEQLEAQAVKKNIPANRANLHSYAEISGELIDYFIKIGVPFSKYDKKRLMYLTDDGSAPGPHIAHALAKQLDDKKLTIDLTQKHCRWKPKTIKLLE